MKYEGVLQLFFINPYRFSPDKVEKVNMLKQSCIKNQIECCLFSSTDCRQMVLIKERMQNEFRQITNNAMIITSNSGDDSLVVNTQLPGGTMSIIWGKYQYFVNQETIFEDKFGRWNSFTLENGEKSILTVTMY